MWVVCIAFLLGILCTAIITMYGSPQSWRRHFKWISLMLLGVLAFAITTIVAFRPNGFGLAIFPQGVALSACLVWLGEIARRKQPRDSSLETLLETMAAAVPSTQEIRPEDVQGEWRFYVDAAKSTVKIDLHANGRYTQIILANSGEQIDCPGGAWTLEKAYLNLESYRSATRAVTESMRWFFGDWRKELVLYAKDDPQSETMLQGRKVKAAVI
jgi:hypothetical protein